MNKTELLFLLDINNYINKKIKLNKCSYYEIRDILIFKFYLLDIFEYDASIKKELDDVLVYFYKCVSTNKLSIDLWTGLTGVCMIFREAYKSNLIKDGNFETIEKIIIDAVEKYYKAHAFTASKETPIKLATLGNDAGIYGAAKLILSKDN